jgi:Resolvase, N terminal domain
MKRLARNAAELMGLSAALEAGGIQLELLTGPLTGVHDPNGMGAMLFAVLAVAAQLDREYIREKTLEGQQAAAAKGNHGGRPKVIDDDMLLFARALKDKGTPIPEIAKKLSIKTGKNAGKHPSVASLYRALAEADSQHAATHPDQAPSVQDQLMVGFVLTLAVPLHRRGGGRSSWWSRSSPCRPYPTRPATTPSSTSAASSLRAAPSS